jgi:FKBP-type peptidyl-prolyl cis-trans isomerase
MGKRYKAIDKKEEEKKAPAELEVVPQSRYYKPEVTKQVTKSGVVNVVEHDSGLQLVDVKKGRGAYPDNGQTVFIKFKGIPSDNITYDITFSPYPNASTCRLYATIVWLPNPRY